MTTATGETSPFDGIGPTDPLMRGAWFSFLLFMIRREEIVEAFRRETGNNWTPGIGINAMIDKATGADAAFVREFAKWSLSMWE